MPDGKALLLGRGNLPVLQDMDTGAETLLDINTSDVAVSSKDGFLLTGSQDGKVQLWSLKDSKIVQDFPGAVFGVNAVALSPNGKRVLACSEQSVLVWDRDNPQDRRITIAHAADATELPVRSVDSMHQSIGSTFAQEARCRARGLLLEDDDAVNDEIAHALPRFFDRETGHRQNVAKRQPPIDERKHPLRAHIEPRSANVGIRDPRGNTPIVEA